MNKLIAIVAMLLIMACSDSPNKPSNDDPVVTLRYIQTSSLQKVSYQVGAVTGIEVNDSINLGQVYSTKTFRFIVMASKRLDSVTVASSNPKFTPDTSYLGTLGAPTSDYDIIPEIEVTAVNGNSPHNANVMVDVMRPDESNTVITISGKNGSEWFSVSYVMFVDAKFYNPVKDSINSKSLTINPESCPVTVKWKNCVSGDVHDTTLVANDVVSLANVVDAVRNQGWFECVSLTAKSKVQVTDITDGEFINKCE